MDNEIGKYVKKKESNTSKADKKSKHKHIYEECIILDTNDKHWRYDKHFPKPLLATYCTVCGKVDNWKIPTVKIKGGYLMMSDTEVEEQYSHLPHFEVNDIWKVDRIEI